MLFITTQQSISNSSVSLTFPHNNGYWQWILQHTVAESTQLRGASSIWQNLFHLKEKEPSYRRKIPNTEQDQFCSLRNIEKNYRQWSHRTALPNVSSLTTRPHPRGERRSAHHENTWSITSHLVRVLQHSHLEGTSTISTLPTPMAKCTWTCRGSEN